MGVPQGSIVGPTLFLVYINHICELKLPMCHIISYADDTALLFHEKGWCSVTKVAENGLKTVMQHLDASLLTLNTDKTKFLAFSLKNSEVIDNVKVHAHKCYGATECDCICLDKVSSLKYLGVILDDRLNWSHHLQVLSGRIRKLMIVFRKLRHVAEWSFLKTIYYSLCQSIIDYCIPVWGGSAKTKMLSIERAQRAVLKVITYRPIIYPTTQLYTDCKVLTVRQLFILRLVLLQHTKTHYDPEYLANRRRKDRVCQIQHVKYTFTKRFSNFLGPYLYNKLSKSNPLYQLTKLECKQTLIKYLLTLNYEETENLLHSII